MEFHVLHPFPLIWALKLSCRSLELCLPYLLRYSLCLVAPLREAFLSEVCQIHLCIAGSTALSFPDLHGFLEPWGGVWLNLVPALQ